MSVPILRIDEFVRSIRVNRNSPHAFFLGAGASLSSGVPSAGRCITEWKRDIFVTNNPSLRDHVSEITLSSVVGRIDSWLKQNGYWPPDGEDDYSYFVEKCLPIAEDRKKFFEPWIREARPHVGYRLLCILAEAQIVRSVWTTNFDGLTARACAATSVVPVEVGHDCQERLFRLPSTSELVCVSLHGDYRYDKLANTVEELQKQEEQLRASLVDTLKSSSLIVCGYSGRDASVMSALEEAVTTDSATKVFWCGYSEEPNKEVSNLIDRAKGAGRDAFYVPGVDFDDLLSRLAAVCIENTESNRVKAILGSTEGSDLPERVAFESFNRPPTHLVKSNAFPLQCPSEVFAFDLVDWPEKKVWKWLADRGAPHHVLAVPFKQVLAFGTIDGIKAAFGEQIKGEIQRVPISKRDLNIEDGAVVSLVRQAIVRAIAERLELDTDGREYIWEPGSIRTEHHGGQSYRVHRCVGLAIRTIGDRSFLTMNPTYYVPSEVDDSNSQTIKKRLLGYQHNKEYNQDLNVWRQKLKSVSQDGVTTVDYPSNSAAFVFKVDPRPVYATVAGVGKTIELPDEVSQLVNTRGIVVREPNLLFAASGGWSPAGDAMPLRGLLNHGPFDLPLSLSKKDESVGISVVCPKAESQILESFLVGIEKKWEPKKGNREDYLVSYPGFSEVFRVPISIPKHSDSRWIELPELDSRLDDRDGALKLARNICDAIRASASMGRSVVVIMTPERWSRWRRFEDESERFDVHNFVKAFAVQHGIATQFLTQEKLAVQDSCRFWWWFSIALYAKSMRTPWLLEGLDDNSAYVGLGYAIDSKSDSGNHIVLGCSHLYNAQGRGLQFRLTRVEDPIIRGGNPYLSFDDARRMGEMIRSLYWESHGRLPQRVVIHKLFPFRFDEQKGLRQGLEGVEEMELLEINHESRLRYLSSRYSNGSFQDDMFPIRRGTALRLSNYEALAWIHGSTDAVRQNWTYFQGKRRIPGPVVIRRYAGRSSFATIFAEILGLSKMDWNSGDLYSQLPATVKSSKSIAQIGSLLRHFGRESYDYRLFM